MVISEFWLNQADDFRPGAELFRSDRTFQLVAYVQSHSQLLFSSDRGALDERANHHPDLLQANRGSQSAEIATGAW